MILLFLTGIMIGLAVAAPVGPIGVLCINRTLKYNLKAGVASGIGAAVADAIYGCIAGFGLVSISSFLLDYEAIIRLLGGGFLIYLGIKSWRSKPNINPAQDLANNIWKDFLSTFLLTLTNPATIMSFIAIFAGFGIVDENANYLSALSLVSGVFIGSLLWWLSLCSVIQVIRHKISNKVALRINQVSGLILLIFGLIALYMGTFSN